jgi:Xaa-Pro aminopeptidase
MVLNSISAPLARRDSWLAEIHEYDGYRESLYSAVAKVVDELGLSAGRIGLEPTFISAADWDELSALLQHAELVNCAPLMHEVRAIKTQGEVALIREAARLLDEVYLEVFPTIREGETERSVHSRIVSGCLERGANWAHGILNSSRNTVLYGGESDWIFESGDVVRNDYVLWYQGYPGHQSRVAILGEPSAEQQSAYRVIRDIYRETIARARPGAIASDIFSFARSAFLEAGLTGMPAIAGHSVGCWWHQQPPYLVSGDEGVLESGMVIAFEPHVPPYHIQDMVLVTDDAPENLSPVIDTDEMLVIASATS